MIRNAPISFVPDADYSRGESSSCRLSTIASGACNSELQDRFGKRTSATAEFCRRIPRHVEGSRLQFAAIKGREMPRFISTLKMEVVRSSETSVRVAIRSRR
jgi:hypothetical protein